MEKNLITEIKKVINEELGISRTVVKETNMLIANIVKNAKEQNKQNNIKKGIFRTFVFSFPIEVEYQIFYLNDSTDIKKLNLVNPGNFKNNYLTTTLCYLRNQNRYVDYNGTTQHEIEHLFQEMKSSKDLLNNDKSKKMYNTATKLAKSTDAFEKIVGYVIYYNNKFEKDAFINEIYKQIMDNWQIDPFETVKNTIVYKNINTIDKVTNTLTPNQKEKINEILNTTFNKTFNWWYNMAKNVVKTYTNKIGKTIIKAQNDIIKFHPHLIFNDIIDENL